MKLVVGLAQNDLKTRFLDRRQLKTHVLLDRELLPPGIAGHSPLCYNCENLHEHFLVFSILYNKVLALWK